jgi:hypothetical protein
MYERKTRQKIIRHLLKNIHCLVIAQFGIVLPNIYFLAFICSYAAFNLNWKIEVMILKQGQVE